MGTAAEILVFVYSCKIHLSIFSVQLLVEEQAPGSVAFCLY